MKNQKLHNSLYKTVSSLFLLLQSKSFEEVHELLLDAGYTNEQLEDISNFIDDELAEECLEIAQTNYLEGVKEISRYVEMGKGYEDMGEISLKLSQEGLEAENEVGITKTEVSTKKE